MANLCLLSVIVTVPVGYLKQFGQQMFSPPLPTSKVLALDGIGKCLKVGWRSKMTTFALSGFGAVEKVFARFTEPFWDPTVTTYDLLWDRPQGWENEEASAAHLVGVSSFDRCLFCSSH